MKVYKIQIVERVAQVFEVEAPNEEMALQKADDLYYEGKFVLEPGELIDTQFEVIED